MQAGEVRVLVDCGLSGAEAARRMTEAGCPPETLSAILVTHEHTDHIQGVGVLSRRFGLPVYVSPDTLAACNGQLSRCDRTVPFRAGQEFAVGTLKVRPFSISHDAADPVGFTFHEGGIKAGLATDLGFMTALAVQHLSACDILVLESNHDPEMLMRGPYPWEVKRRIQGRRGHLSNTEAGRLLGRVIHQDLQQVVLAHLSEKTNHPELALRSAGEVIERHRLCGKVNLCVAGPTQVVTVSAGAGNGSTPRGNA